MSQSLFRGIVMYESVFVSVFESEELFALATKALNGLIFKMKSLNLAADVKSKIDGY